MSLPAWLRKTLSLLAFALFSAPALPASAWAGPCAEEKFEGASYLVCTIDPASADLRLFWKNADGAPYRSFSSLADALGALEERLIFAINAGMYQSVFLPLGLYVEDGRELRPVVTAGMDGQLHPALIPGSSDRTRRSGVGVYRDGLVRFALSEGAVNFHDFARLFRDRLDCPNALFLDGGRGVGLYLPEVGRNDFSWHGGYGPIFGLVE